MEIIFICLVLIGIASAGVFGYLIGKKIYEYMQIRKISKSAINTDGNKKDNLFF